MKLRMTVEVEYNLNGEKPTEMVVMLDRVMEHAMGDAWITGETKAEVANISWTIDEVLNRHMTKPMLIRP